jgi:hypothetical protein
MIASGHVHYHLVMHWRIAHLLEFCHTCNIPEVPDLIISQAMIVCWNRGSALYCGYTSVEFQVRDDSEMTRCRDREADTWHLAYLAARDHSTASDLASLERLPQFFIGG